MAKQTRAKLRYDDFVARVHADPAKVEPTTMLHGYIGRGAAKGTVRIYPDPTLGTWYEVAEADIVHAQPIEKAPLGGSHVWIKSSASITPGSSLPAAAVPFAQWPRCI